MMSALELLLIPFCAIGHLGIWVLPYNRINGTGLPRTFVKVSELLIVLALLAVSLLLVLKVIQAGWSYQTLLVGTALAQAAAVYLGVAAVVGVGLVSHWLWQQWHDGPPEQLLSTESRLINVREHLQVPLSGNASTSVLARFPGNQVFSLDVNKKVMQLQNLHAELDGLTITHFSDLHLTGQIRREFFEFVVNQANLLKSDLIAITGDIVDKSHCLDWIPDTLGKLRAPLGVFYLLGNHDKKLPDEAKLRQSIDDAGLTGVGGKTIRLQPANAGIVVAGNERPWFKSLGQLNGIVNAGDLRLLLSHSPDQFRWAQQEGFDIMLAGHTHGGQIRLPVVGPIIAPSVHGVKYASGVFHTAPTLMHVSRGLSGVQTIRLNCAPELTQIVLRSPEQQQRASN